MRDPEISELLEDIAAIKKSIRRANPLLRDIAAPDSFLWLSLVAALLFPFVAVPAHVLSMEYGGLLKAPAEYLVPLGLFTLLSLVVVGVVKLAILSRAARRSDGQSSLRDVFASFYGGSLLHVTLPVIVTMLVLGAFAVSIGRPWLILPFVTILVGFMTNLLGASVDLPEYHVAGYYGFAVGFASLWFVERAPWLWLIAAYSGLFAVFAVAGFLTRAARRRRDAPAADGASGPDAGASA